MKKMLVAAACAAAFLCVSAGVAIADAGVTVIAPAAPSALVDLTQVAIAALPFVFGILAVVVQKGISKIAAWLRLQNDAALSAQFNPLAQLALAAAQNSLSTLINQKGLTVDVKSQLVAEAGRWMADHAAQQIAAKKYDPVDVANHLAAMLHLNTTPPEQSIALPTPAATPGGGLIAKSA